MGNLRYIRLLKSLLLVSLQKSQTSTDCGYFEDVIKSYNRLLDLKEKYVDIDVLKALKMSVEKNLTDPSNTPIHKHKQKILKLFGRITSIVIKKIIITITITVIN